MEWIHEVLLLLLLLKEFPPERFYALCVVFLIFGLAYLRHSK